MNVTLVTQGPVATRLLEQLLVQHALLRSSAIRVRDGGGHGGSFSKARTILTVRREPVAVLVDMEAAEPAYMADRRELLESLLDEAAPPWAWRLILFVPEVELLFFQDERLLRELVRPAMPSAEQLRQARETPRKVLCELLATRADNYAQEVSRRLAPLEVSGLWKLPELRVLEDFLLARLRPQRPSTAP